MPLTVKGACARDISAARIDMQKANVDAKQRCENKQRAMMLPLLHFPRAFKFLLRAPRNAPSEHSKFQRNSMVPVTRRRAGCSPSPLNGERAGVRGETV